VKSAPAEAEDSAPQHVGIEAPQTKGSVLMAVDTQFYVLTNGFWPTFPAFTFQIPVELLSILQRFESFYLFKHRGRRLEWAHQVSTCTVRAVFDKGRKEIICTLFQACVMMLFNTELSWTVASIAERLGVDAKSPDVICGLLSISTGVQCVLVKHAIGGHAEGGERREGTAPVTPSDTLRFNASFVHKLSKIRINQVQARDQKAESVATTERVIVERSYVVDAAVVRLMKSRRRASHAEVVKEVASMLRFPVAPADLKKRIEHLIERGYLERDAEDQSSYNYLA
jgi:cullin-4